jgi:hypothetical protein
VINISSTPAPLYLFASPHLHVNQNRKPYNLLSSPTPIDVNRSSSNGLPSGCGMLMLSFLALCAIYSFSLVFGNLIAVRMLLPLVLRECEGVRGGRGSSCSCFLVILKLRVSGADVSRMGLVVLGLGGGGRSGASPGESGRPTGVDDAMVPPTPAREVASVLMLRGAYLVIEHGVGSMLVAGVMRAGLCGEPMAMTNGILELEAALSFRSEGENDRIGVSAALDPADIARE